jgi:polyferredoxin
MQTQVKKKKEKTKSTLSKIVRYALWIILGLFVLAIFILIILLQNINIEKK